MKKLTGLLLFLFCLQTVIAVEIGPQELIEQTTSRLLIEIKSNSEKFQQDPSKLYSLVDEVVLPHFDFESMIDLVLGRYRNKVSAEQRPLIVKEFQALLVRTYSRALLDYNDQEIIYLPMEISIETGSATVKTEIEQAGGFPIPLNYSLKQSDHGWKVYDISVDDVSLVTNYSASFARQIRKHGVDGLIETLRERNQDRQI
ncbi:MAG: phospholipid-binding protein MlaC [Gammaproteobacteria bacterium]